MPLCRPARTLVAALVAVLAPLGAAHAQLNFTFAYSGSGLTASGTLFTNGVVSNGAYTVTGITGTRNGQMITGLVGRGGIGGNDNLLFYPDQPYLDISGISYNVGSAAYNVYYCGVATCSQGTGYHELSTGEGITPPLTMTVTPASTVPEPSTWALMGTGLVTLGGAAVRRRRTASV